MADKEFLKEWRMDYRARMKPPEDELLCLSDSQQVVSNSADIFKCSQKNMMEAARFILP